MKQGKYLLLALLSLCGPAWSSTLGNGNDFTNIALGPREAAMGQTGAALSRDVFASSWNVAGLGGIENVEFSALEMLYITGINFGSLGYGQKVFKHDAIGVQFMILNGDDTLRDDKGDVIGSFHNAVYSLAGGISHELLTGLWVGALYRGVQEQFDVEIHNLSQVDLGIAYDLPMIPLSLGITSQDIAIAQFKEFKAGLAFKALDGALVVSADTFYPDLYVRGGAEIGFGQGGQRLSFRAGFQQDAYVNHIGGLTAGLGFRTAPNQGLSYLIDYSYVPFGLFGSIHQFGLTLSFAGPGPRGIPVSLNYLVLDNDRIEVAWKAPVKGDPIGYNVYKLEPWGARVKVNELPLTSPTQTLRHVDRSKPYRLAVAGVYPDGESELSVPLVIPAVVVPKKP